jgi:hypothetical protein
MIPIRLLLIAAALAAPLVLSACGGRCGLTSPGYPLCGI